MFYKQLNKFIWSVGNFVFSLKTLVLLVGCLCLLTACGSVSKKAEPAKEEAEPIARTEFTERIENFFEYDALKARKPSNFLIHLTDLSDGSPVEKAEVTLKVRDKSGTQILEHIAKVGRVTGIYVAELEIPQQGNVEIEFRIKNSKLDERMILKNFEVE